MNVIATSGNISKFVDNAVNKLQDDAYKITYPIRFQGYNAQLAKVEAPAFQAVQETDSIKHTKIEFGEGDQVVKFECYSQVITWVDQSTNKQVSRKVPRVAVTDLGAWLDFEIAMKEYNMESMFYTMILLMSHETFMNNKFDEEVANNVGPVLIEKLLNPDTAINYTRNFLTSVVGLSDAKKRELLEKIESMKADTQIRHILLNQIMTAYINSLKSIRKSLTGLKAVKTAHVASTGTQPVAVQQKPSKAVELDMRDPNKPAARPNSYNNIL